jgi:hypothetical protein
MGGVWCKQGELRNTDNALVRKPEGKIPLVKFRRIREDNIRIDLKK